MKNFRESSCCSFVFGRQKFLTKPLGYRSLRESLLFHINYGNDNFVLVVRDICGCTQNFPQPMLSSWVLHQTHIHQGNMSSLVGNIVSNKCCPYLEVMYERPPNYTLLKRIFINRWRSRRRMTPLYSRVPGGGGVLRKPFLLQKYIFKLPSIIP